MEGHIVSQGHRQVGAWGLLKHPQIWHFYVKDIAQSSKSYYPQTKKKKQTCLQACQYLAQLQELSSARPRSSTHVIGLGRLGEGGHIPLGSALRQELGTMENKNVLLENWIR